MCQSEYEHRYLFILSVCPCLIEIWNTVAPDERHHEVRRHRRIALGNTKMFEPTRYGALIVLLQHHTRVPHNSYITVAS